MAIGITKAAISSMERGITKAATPEHLFKIAKVLECDAEWLATGKKPESVKEKRQPYVSNREKEVVENFRRLSKSKQEKVIAFMDGLKTASQK